MEDIEELLIDDGEELELVEKLRQEPFKMPVIYVSEKTMTFNQRSLGLVPPRVKWFTTHEYVIGLPASEDDKNGYNIRMANGIYFATTPSVLRNMKKLKNGWYQLYKYKNGFAFKRYDPLEL